jgi:hypothetical protein
VAAVSADNGESPDRLLWVLAGWMADYCDVPNILATGPPGARSRGGGSVDARLAGRTGLSRPQRASRAIT